jgi:hypothetical protein
VSLDGDIRGREAIVLVCRTQRESTQRWVSPYVTAVAEAPMFTTETIRSSL